MPDYIKRSSDLHEWLLAQGITLNEIEEDGEAPCVARRPASTPPPGAYVDDGYEVRLRNDTCLRDYVCPFYGPGGEGNLLRALRGLEDKRLASGLRMLHNTVKGMPPSVYYEATAKVGSAEYWPHFYGEGKTDGIALAELLWKIREAS